MNVLPTGVFATWTVTDFRDSILSILANDLKSRELRLCFYGVTLNGWDQLREPIRTWMSRGGGKTVAIVGTDHGLTDPDCLDEMLADGVALYLMVDYVGLYHPKMAWLTEGEEDVVWIGSNNLTENGLLQNIELASLIRFKGQEATLANWYEGVRESASAATPELLKSYRRERDNYGKAISRVGAFTWSKRTTRVAPATRQRRRPAPRSATLEPATGDLVMEIMRHETGPNGKQVQVPKTAALRFFGLKNRMGSTLKINLANVPSGHPRDLTMTLFDNKTSRLSLRELEYRHRPCVCIFHKLPNRFEYEIVPRAIFPQRYDELLSMCGPPTREGSRRFGFVK